MMMEALSMLTACLMQIEDKKMEAKNRLKMNTLTMQVTLDIFPQIM
jgi:hypothetical protein